MQRRTFLLHGAVIATLAAVAIPAAQAQAWPSRPIRLVVGFAPGGGTDIIARALAPRISELLGQQVVVENRPGASGVIAADTVAKSPADGYTLLMGHSNSNAIAPNVFPKTPYNPSTDFTPITYIGSVPNILVVHPSLPAKSVPELIDLVRKQPGHYSYASSGIGSVQHLAGALFSRIANLQMSHIPYKGSGQAIVDLLAGQVNMNFDTMPPVLEHAKSGKLRPLAISTTERVSQLPDVPTFNEVGIRGFDVTSWYSIMGPKDLPHEVVAKMNDTVQKAMQDPAIRPKLEAQGVQFGGPKTPAEFDRFLKTEISKYAKLTKELNVKAE